jgi:NAD(P)-dependent dehydrogenase (short-subunit alcohol dehydrogenase family)
MNHRCSDLVVVLTGASSGIGHATALAFAREGARLVLASRGKEGLEAVAQRCRATGAQALVVPTDVTDAAAVRALADMALQFFGRIDVWINNVGVGVVGLFDETPIESHRRVVEANLLGHMHGAHAALGHFRERRRGTLINMISIGGLASAPYSAAYTASKFALRGFSEAVRAEMSPFPDVHVCEVYPTFVDTPGLSHGGNHTGRRIKPPPPLLDPREVAARVVALALKPRDAVTLGSVAWPARVLHAVAPGTVGALVLRLMDAALRRAAPAPVTDGNLFEPSVGTPIDGGYRRARRPAASTTAIAVGAGVAAAGLAWWAARARSRPR